MSPVDKLPNRYRPLRRSGDFAFRHAGFSLIELIAVLVIVGIVGATALPRFVDLGRDARLASLYTLEKSLRTTASLLHAHCLLTAGCAAASGFFYLPYDGRVLLIQNAYPEAGDVIGGDQIDSIMILSGFTVVLPNNLTHRFQISSAPTPSNCSVSYKQAASLGAEPTISVVITGC